jgi:hypothetical protein
MTSRTIPFRVAMDTALLVWQGGMPMMRQIFCRGLVMGTVAVGLMGCETHHWLRPKDNNEVSQKDDKDDPTKPGAVDSDASKIKSVDSDGNNSQPFFKRTRSASSFSSFSPEAQAIEKDLGVY